jgi:hypothetical protein
MMEGSEPDRSSEKCIVRDFRGRDDNTDIGSVEIVRARTSRSADEGRPAVGYRGYW